ncbi:MAG TPA: TonB-dependent receptor [Bacteroidota bacterium]|nr:TonB-dependent receptor [Bacteroidota bacterium]
MKNLIGIIVVCSFIFSSLHAQKNISGDVMEKNVSGESIPVIGANVFWLHTAIGTTTDDHGKFQLQKYPQSDVLVVRCIGYTSDTISVGNRTQLHIYLQSETKQIDSASVIGSRPDSYLDYTSTNNSLTMTSKELQKAACCNLSESFQTNPSIDVSFTDAITGTKQIEMLGLAGSYSQITLENLPAIRGLTSNVGLTYIPGTWIESIQLSKGIGSVANGFESVTGQINVELKKPIDTTNKILFLNLYTNQNQRMEANLLLREPINDNISAMTLLHASTLKNKVDENDDRFLDMPIGSTFNFLQRFQFIGSNNLASQLNVQIVDDDKKGGTVDGYSLDRDSLLSHPDEYAFSIHSHQVRVSSKNGYVFPGSLYHSIGLQASYAEYQQDASFELRQYHGLEKTGYVNLLYQTQLGSKIHTLRFGGSFLFDSFDESLDLVPYNRIERVPGAFAEYTFEPSDDFSLVAGLRADNDNLFGTFVTPRLHIRYTPQDDWVLRFVAGRGERTANVLAENMAYFASSRSIHLPSFANGYPFAQEAAWNYGLNLTHYFLWAYHEATLSFDVYRTEFEKQVVVDLDHSPQEVLFYNLAGVSYSNSFQTELDVQPIDRLETRIAYRYLDVRQTIDGVERYKPFVARQRAFVNFGYSSEKDEASSSQMLYDLTVQWTGRKRLPDTQSNPANLRADSFSPDFFLVNGQITRSWGNGLDMYIGVENLFNFRQDNPILDAAHPNSSYFDSSIVWGPISGRMLYIGLRWNV